MFITCKNKPLIYGSVLQSNIIFDMLECSLYIYDILQVIHQETSMVFSKYFVLNAFIAGLQELFYTFLKINTKPNVSQSNRLYNKFIIVSIFHEHLEYSLLFFVHKNRKYNVL